ncbi:hypothetical protein BLS_004124 [Venturia inaequalis]|uniref:Urease accessory protein n=1 Tax=Venturia inaequalis TaxID=5025 RepID=A0A8H3V9G5_VENIN|nr:hypothetical protein EG328_000215 [Venturia inaequalis]KAE9983542.1 hypothetical protein BLS_004124 [Venturia inaequalis]RDI87864.1 hypothetical protein Vi05172_g1844 [Venturia inaequalis]
MPHKHKRVKTTDAKDKEGQFNLPPTSLAKPLAAFKDAKPDARQPSSNKRRKKTNSGAIKDDTPKAFLRLMELKNTGKGRNGLDNGESKTATKKRKRTQAAEAAPTEEPKEAAAPALKILPGERLGDFAARVDQNMPIIGLARKGIKERQTKHEKKLQKMVNTWKENEAKRLEKAEDEWEAEEEKEQEEKEALEAKHGAIPVIQTRKGLKKGVDDDDDPWAVLEARRERPKGLHDVAQAPPTFTNMPKETFKVRGGAKVNVTDVPNAAGSLKRREELGQTRADVIAQYRKMMALQRAE